MRTARKPKKKPKRPHPPSKPEECDAPVSDFFKSSTDPLTDLDPYRDMPRQLDEAVYDYKALLPHVHKIVFFFAFLLPFLGSAYYFRRSRTQTEAEREANEQKTSSEGEGGQRKDEPRK